MTGKQAASASAEKGREGAQSGVPRSDGAFSHARVAGQTAVLAVLATVGAVGLYVGWFWLVLERPISRSPDTWGAFGDYFGGIAGPVIAFFALVWLLRSVGVQTKELAETREALAKSADAARGQLEEMRTASLRSALLERAETVYADVRNHLDRDQLIPYRAVEGSPSVIMISFIKMMHRDKSPRTVPDARVQHASPVIRRDWQERLGPFVRDLRELCHYLDRIDILSGGDKGVTDYFRRRLVEPVTWLHTNEYVSEDLTARITPADASDATPSG